MSRALAGILMVVLAAALIAACNENGGGDSEPPTIAPFDREPCWFEEPEGETVECGLLEVPADRQDSDAGVIQLAVAVFAARSKTPAPDPIVYLEGGPGGRVLELAPEAFETLIDPYLDDRDFVIFDQRGVGLSEPRMQCPEIQQLGRYGLVEGFTEEDYVIAVAASVDACRVRLRDEQIPLGLANSAESAADLEDLRWALGYGEWNLYGISYGTRLALTAMRDHPAGIRSVILDSVYPPEVDFLATAPAEFSRALDVLFRDCAADAACAAAYPDLRGTLFSTAERLDRERPVVPVPGDLAAVISEVTLTGESLLSMVFSALYVKELLPELPKVISDVSKGVYDRAALVAASLELSFEYVDYGMYLSVQCTEEIPLGSREEALRVKEQYPEVAPAYYGEPDLSFDSCEAFGVEPAGDIENQAVEAEIPALILGGSYDPITPPEWGRAAAGKIKGARAFEFPGDGHAVSTSNKCAESLVKAFLAAPDKELPADCVDDEKPPAFQ
jgi:pimeloyl-ACP methyl ester carboxylesterase